MSTETLAPFPSPAAGPPLSFDEHLSAGDAFCAAAREALRAARAEAQPLSDPRLRFVTEVAVGDEVL